MKKPKIYFISRNLKTSLRYLSLSLTFLLSNYHLNSQNNGPKWSPAGNTVGVGDFIGSTNNFALDFKTNNTLRMVLDANGNLRIINFIGTGNRLLQTDASGNLSPFLMGTSTQVLYGNGIWGNLPVAATTFTNNGTNIFLPASSKLGIGTNVPTEALEVTGNIKVSGDIITSSTSTLTSGGLRSTNLIGSSYSIVYADPQGNLLKAIPGTGGPYTGIVGPCVNGALPWYNGGNLVPADMSVGTCNAFDFILKSHGQDRVFMKGDGTISFGNNIASNTGGKEYIFSQGAQRLTGNNTFGGPQIIFDNDAGGISPFGDWGIEYTGGTSAPQPGLNFWKPFASANSNNNILFLHDNNRIGIGTDNPTSRLTIDSWSDDGIKVLSDANKKSIEVFNKSTNKTEFVVTSDGVLYSREIYVKLGNIPDYVFESSYKLPTINETKNYVLKYKHLKNMINCNNLTEKGANLGEFQRITLEKLEEAYLYIFQLNERLEFLEKELLELKSK